MLEMLKYLQLLKVLSYWNLNRVVEAFTKRLQILKYYHIGI